MDDSREEKKREISNQGFKNGKTERMEIKKRWNDRKGEERKGRKIGEREIKEERKGYGRVGKWGEGRKVR